MAKRILVVEDDPLVRKVVTLVLEDAGYGVEAAADGIDALARIESAPPDLVLTDIALPGIDGLDLLWRIGQMPEPPAAVVISARVDERLAARSLGAAQFVPKPFDLDRLLTIVERTLEHSQLNDRRTPD